MIFIDLPQSSFFKVEKGGKELRYNCPFCAERKGSPDAKGHLHINVEKGIYHCFRCEASFKNTGVILRKFHKSKNLDQNKLVKVDKVNLPQPYYQLFESKDDFFPIFRDYAKSRGITNLEIKKYYIGFTGDINSPFFGRLIFCWKDNGKITFFQGRDVIGNSPKYLSMGNKPFFSSFKDPVDCAIVTEGIFDMINASKVIPSGAVLGHSVSPEQRKTINYLIKDKIILIFDADSYSQIVSFVNMFPNKKVHPIFLSRKKDLGEMSISEIKEILRNGLRAYYS